MKSLVLGTVLLGSLAVLASCAPYVRAPEYPSTDLQVQQVEVLTADGGRLDWCHADNLVAFDRIVDSMPLRTEVYTIRPDGSEEFCVTCDQPDLPAGLRGRPVWHPSCDYMVLQVQSEHFQEAAWPFEFFDFGINHELWAVAADGSWVVQLAEVEAAGAVQNPRFSAEGDRLFWSAREPFQEQLADRDSRGRPTPENPWDGWFLSIADVENAEDGLPALFEPRELYRGEGGFFQATALVEDRIWFSHTPPGRPFIENLYTAQEDGARRRVVYPFSGSWNERIVPSPDGRYVAFISSRGFRWRPAPGRLASLRTELWVDQRGRSFPVQITDENLRLSRADRSRIVDFAWGPNAESIAILRTESGGRPGRQVIEILHLTSRAPQE